MRTRQTVGRRDATAAHGHWDDGKAISVRHLSANAVRDEWVLGLSDQPVEVDRRARYNAVPHFMAILDGGLPCATPDVLLDLAGLRFVDVAGARALMRAVARTSGTGRTPIVVSPRRPVERVLRLLGVAETLGLGSGLPTRASELRLAAPDSLVAGAGR